MDLVTKMTDQQLQDERKRLEGERARLAGLIRAIDGEIGRRLCPFAFGDIVEKTDRDGKSPRRYRIESVKNSYCDEWEAVVTNIKRDGSEGSTSKLHSYQAKRMTKV